MSYGRQISTLNTNWFSPRIIEGERVVYESLVRRLQSNLWYDSTYGFPLLNLLNSTMKNEEIVQNVTKQLNLDDRLDQVEVSVVRDSTDRSRETVTLTIRANMVDSEQTFELIVPVNSGGLVADMLVINEEV